MGNRLASARFRFVNNSENLSAQGRARQNDAGSDVVEKYIGRIRVVQRREAWLIICCAALLTSLCIHLDTFERVVDFVHSHESWQLDEYLVVAFFAGFASLALAFRRSRELALEIRLREESEKRERKLARHDPLTGLVNRRVLVEAFDTMAGEGRASNHRCALMLIDLDHFKPVNDLYGHSVGDAVLVEVASRLKDTLGSQHLVARLGGDEFACLIHYHDEEFDVARIAGSLVRRLGRPFNISGVTVDIGASVGIGLGPVDGESAEDLLRAADVAMYEAKRSGKDRYCFFHSEMDSRLRERATLESDLRGAVKRGELVAYFQPVIALDDNKVIGLETLARWEHPERGLLMPELFIPIAEDIGVIGELSYEMLRQGCKAAKNWPDDVSLSLNISPVQLKDTWLPIRIVEILKREGIAPNRLIIEVTENAIIDDIALAGKVFESLQNAGIRIALDDFGKGYSSLSHLHQLHFNHLKIDGAFVRSIDSKESREIVDAISGLGRSLGMSVVAEGVETEECATALRAIGCEQAQGYLFGRPCNADETASLFDVSNVTIVDLTKRRA